MNRSAVQPFVLRIIAAIGVVSTGIFVLLGSRYDTTHPAFYLYIALPATVWLFAGTALMVMNPQTERLRRDNEILIGTVAGGVLGLGGMLGALLAPRIGWLAGPVQEAAAQVAAAPLAAFVVAAGVWGASQEVFFRGGLFAVWPLRPSEGGGAPRLLVPVLATTVCAALVLSASGSVLLTVCGTVTALVLAVTRSLTGGLLGPILAHLMALTGVLLPLGLTAAG